MGELAACKKKEDEKCPLAKLLKTVKANREKQYDEAKQYEAKGLLVDKHGAGAHSVDDTETRIDEWWKKECGAFVSAISQGDEENYGFFTPLREFYKKKDTSWIRTILGRAAGDKSEID